MAAYIFLAGKRKTVEHHSLLYLMVLAQSGDDKAVKKQFEDWEKEI